MSDQHHPGQGGQHSRLRLQTELSGRGQIQDGVSKSGRRCSVRGDPHFLQSQGKESFFIMTL